MRSTIHPNNNNSAESQTTIARDLADDDPNIGSLDHFGKTKTSETDNGDSGASLSYDNNLLSPALSTGSQFPDNLNSSNPARQSEAMDKSQAIGFPMENTYKQRESREDTSKSINDLQKQLEWTRRNVDLLKQENASLENALASSGSWRDPLSNPNGLESSSRSMASNPTLLLTNFKLEMTSFKAELSRINSILESCELGRRTFSDRWSNSIGGSLQQINQSLNGLLLRTLDNPIEKVLMSSLQSRLKSTEDRLKRNRMEMNDSISKVEERLVVENVELKMSENEVKRKLHQSTNQIEAMRKNHQSLMEIYQRLKVRSSDNGFIDLQEILKRLSIEDAEAKHGKEEVGVSKDAIFQIKEDVTKQISTLVSEKQVLNTDLSGTMDEMELTRKENDRLKKSLNELNSIWESNMSEFRATQTSTVERILTQLESFSSDVRQMCRCNEGTIDTIKVLEDVVDTKERLLSSALTELDKLKSTVRQPQPDEPTKQTHKSDQLSAILDFMRFKEGVSQPYQSTQDLTPSNNESVQAELLRLTAQRSKLEHDLEFSEKNLQFQKEEVEALQSQLNSCRDDLRLKTQQLDVTTSNEMDLRRELKMHREWMDALNAQLLEKEKQLKLLELDKGSVQKLLEKDSLNLETKVGADDADVKFIKQALELDLMTTKNAIDMSVKENLLLKQSLEQAARDLAAERDVTSSTTYDKLILQQELYAAKQERDAMVKERDELKRNNSLIQLENQKLASQLKRGINMESDSQLQERVKNLTTELQDMKRRLESKEKDSAFFQDTLKFVLKSNEDPQVKKS